MDGSYLAVDTPGSPTERSNNLIISILDEEDSSHCNYFFLSFFNKFAVGCLGETNLRLRGNSVVDANEDGIC